MKASSICSNNLETKDCKTDFTLVEHANSLTKAELEIMCKAHMIRIKHRSSKDQYVQSLVDYLLNNTRKVLSQLSVWDLVVVRNLVSIGPGKGLAIVREACSTILFDILLLKVERNQEDEECWYIMSDELRNAIGLQVEEILVDPIYQKRAEMLQFIQGLKTLYGIVQVEFIREKLRNSFPGTTVNLEIMREVVVCPENMMNIADSDEFCFYSPIVAETFEDPEGLDLMINESLYYKEFTRQEIMDAGHQPYPIFRSEQAIRLKQFLRKKTKIDEEYADSVICKIWTEAQPLLNNYLRSIYLVNNWFMSNKQEDWDRLVFLVNQFLDVAPHWALLGYSPEEDRMERVALRLNNDEINEEEMEEEEEEEEENAEELFNSHFKIQYVS